MRRHSATRRIVAPFLGVGIERVPGLARMYRRLYAALGPMGLHELPVNGLRMVADFDDTAITPSLWLRGRYEPTATLAFRGLVAPGSCVVDVGAHIGYYSLLAGDLAGPDGTVLAFEPNPLARSLLTLNVRLNGFDNVRVSALALSDRCGSGRLHVQRGVTGAGSLEPSCVSHPYSVHAVELATLDAVCGARAPTLIKLDAQGSEGRVLRGATALLRRCRPAVLLEFNPKQLTASGTRPASILAMLTELRYSLLLVDEEIRGLRALPGPDILEICRRERRDGAGFRNIVAAQPAHRRELVRAGLVMDP